MVQRRCVGWHRSAPLRSRPGKAMGHPAECTGDVGGEYGQGTRAGPSVRGAARSSVHDGGIRPRYRFRPLPPALGEGAPAGAACSAAGTPKTSPHSPHRTCLPRTLSGTCRIARQRNRGQINVIGMVRQYFLDALLRQPRPAVALRLPGHRRRERWATALLSYGHYDIGSGGGSAKEFVCWL